MVKKIPEILIFLRLIIGFLIIFLALFGVENIGTITVVLLTLGLITDIFDGIIARNLGVSTQKLRRLDSLIDQIFFVCVIVSAYLQCPAFFSENKWLLSILIGSEVLIYLVSYIKFQKEIATHSIGAKIWTLILFATLIQIIIECDAPLLFLVCFWVGLLTRIEIIAIIFILKEWTNDVPTFYHAIRLRKGLPIKKNKLFNG